MTQISEPIIAFAIEPKSVQDRHRLDVALSQLMAEEPTLRARTDDDTRQVIVAGSSERQLQRISERLTGEFGVDLVAGVFRVIYKVMFTHAADGEGKFVKQGGGSSRYAHAKIHLHPGDPGRGFVFRNAIHGGSIPTSFIAPVKLGIAEALARLTADVCALDAVDVTVELYDGSYHDQDSTEMAFKIAGSMAFQEASRKAGAVVLEPVMRVAIVVPDDCVAEVLGELRARRGVIQSIEEDGRLRVIHARVPLSTILGYEAHLLSRTRERGTCRIEFDRYEPASSTPDSGSDEGFSSVREPRPRRPTLDASAIALPEPEEDDEER